MLQNSLCSRRLLAVETEMSKVKISAFQQLSRWWNRTYLKEFVSAVSQRTPAERGTSVGQGHAGHSCVPLGGLARAGRAQLTTQPSRAAQGSPSICSVPSESPSPIKHPCISATDTLLRAEFCLNPPSDGHAQVRVTFVLGVLVYGLFNYTQSLKHLHDALKYSWPFLFNFICLLVFGDYPAKHSVNSIKFIPQLIQSPMTMEASPL